MPPKGGKKIPIEAKKTEEPVIVQLSIPQERFDEIIRGDDMQLFEYNPTLHDPNPYVPTDIFESSHEALLIQTTVNETEIFTDDKKNTTSDEPMSHHICFWCCHPAESVSLGMPLSYDNEHRYFKSYGTFCSLECTAAFNLTTHMGMEKAWEIHSLIQLMGRQMNQILPIRPAPSRYILKMFGGPQTINEFRQAHKGTNKTYLLNIPPLVAVSTQFEMLNTSYITSSTEIKQPKATTKPLDSKLNITFSTNKSI